ncbi:MAG TPA: amidohydrolase family protein [Bacteroidia bacterium]|nr:amidohydrolase family protein [Bacteroidia bacterium]
MKLFQLIILFAFSHLFSSAQSNYTTIINVNLFDGHHIFENVNFTFSDSIIISISDKFIDYKNATIIDGHGKTILPPLINAHVHIAGPENLKEALDVGIFAMMDMFTLDKRANRLRAYNDSIGYAHYYSSNVGATVPGGHGTEYKVTIPTINDTVTAREFVRDRVNQGADYIKISQEHSMALLNQNQLTEIISEAHSLNKITVAHISELGDALQLTETDVDGLAHIWYLKSSVASGADLSLMQSKNIFVIPTLSVIEKLIENTDSAERKNYLAIDDVFKEVKKVYDAGIPILAGTDARNFGMNFTTQFFDELILLSRCGLSNLDILKSATSNIYQAFNLKEFKILKEKSSANFLLVDGKPDLNIEDIYKPKRIWKDGLEISG